MLEANQILENKTRFLSLLSQINIEGARIQELSDFLCTSDFFVAPCSTQYHNNYKGGLCEHSLHVYDTLVELYNKFKDTLPNPIDPNSLLICGLLHDISKVNFYEEYDRNVKVDGKWEAHKEFRIKDAHDRFLFGTHEENSLVIIGRYIPLNDEEMAAITNHHAGLGNPNQNWDLSAISNRYPLLPLLHSADYISTFILERV